MNVCTPKTINSTRDFIKYLLSRLITVLRIECTKINGKQFLLSGSNRHINNMIEQSTKWCKRGTEAHKIQERNHRNDDT